MPYTGRRRRRRGHFSPWVTPGNSSLVGIYRPVPQILTRFQTKKCNFPHPFSDLAFTQKLCYHYLPVRAQTKNYSNPFRIRIFLFLAYSFGIETINTFIHSVVPSKTIPDSRPKWAKCIPVFRPKRRKNPTLWDRELPIISVLVSPKGLRVVLRFRGTICQKKV